MASLAEALLKKLDGMEQRPEVKEFSNALRQFDGSSRQFDGFSPHNKKAVVLNTK